MMHLCTSNSPCMSVDTSGRLCVLTLVMLPLLISTKSKQTKSHTHDELLKTRRSLTTCLHEFLNFKFSKYPPNTHTVTYTHQEEEEQRPIGNCGQLELLEQRPRQYSFHSLVHHRHRHSLTYSSSSCSKEKCTHTTGAWSKPAARLQKPPNNKVQRKNKTQNSFSELIKEASQVLGHIYILGSTN
jgi:hypothetical protein